MQMRVEARAYQESILLTILSAGWRLPKLNCILETGGDDLVDR